MQNKELPLEGLTVLDFSRFLPAPYCSMVLGDFGAKIIRIEQPGEVKKQEKIFGRDKLGKERKQQLKYREMVSRNKLSVLLNLRDSTACDAVRKMAGSSDVILHDYRPGVMEAMGLGYKDIQKINPGIVYCGVSLSGDTGPNANLPGHEPIAMALAGALTRFGDGEKPMIPGLPVGDLSTGLQAAIGILLALREKDKSGKGQFVDIAMTDSALSLMTSVMQRFLIDEKEPPQHWNAGNVGLWETKDGQYLCTTDLEPAYWGKFCQAVDRPDLIPLQYDHEQRQYLDEQLADIFLQKNRDEWFAYLKQWGTQVAPVYSLSEALEDEHALSRKSVLSIKDRDGNTSRQIATAIKLSRTPGTIRELAHLAGEDTESVLQGFGFSEKDISSLLSK